MSKFERPRHRLVQRALGTLDAGFLARARCYFGGGTRIVMALGEYRESADIDLLCADREGYRALRSQVTDRSLGAIAAADIALAREVIADRYGIRTVLDVAGEKLKFEIILEGRIALSGAGNRDLRVPALDPVSCFAEKFLANADRWNDESFRARDVIDLAFMIARWETRAAIEGHRIAQGAYGQAVNRSLKRAVAKMREQGDYRRKCVAALAVSDTRGLNAGLKLLAAQRWRAA